MELCAPVVNCTEYARAQTAHERGGVSDIELSRQLAERDRSRAQVDSNGAAVEGG